MVLHLRVAALTDAAKTTFDHVLKHCNAMTKVNLLSPFPSLYIAIECSSNCSSALRRQASPVSYGHLLTVQISGLSNSDSVSNVGVASLLVHKQNMCGAEQSSPPSGAASLRLIGYPGNISEVTLGFSHHETLTPITLTFSKSKLSVLKTSLVPDITVQPMREERLEKVRTMLIQELTMKMVSYETKPRSDTCDYLLKTTCQPLSSGECRADDLIQSFCRALHSDDVDDVLLNDLRCGFIRLIGRGLGLTPSSDDFVVGILAPLTASPSLRIQRLLSLLNIEWGKIVRQQHLTTDVARMFLSHALLGHFSPNIRLLVELIFTSDDDTQIRQAIQTVMKFGASSGFDTVVGVLGAITVMRDGDR